jgi:hypothetical protein
MPRTDLLLNEILAIRRASSRVSWDSIQAGSSRRALCVIIWRGPIRIWLGLASSQNREANIHQAPLGHSREIIASLFLITSLFLIKCSEKLRASFSSAARRVWSDCRSGNAPLWLVTVS